MKIVRYEYLSRYSEAIRIGQEALAPFGLQFPDSPEERACSLERELTTIAQLIGTRSIESLIGLPMMNDPESCAAMQLLASLHTPCYLSADKVLTLLKTAWKLRTSIFKRRSGANMTSRRLSAIAPRCWSCSGRLK